MRKSILLLFFFSGIAFSLFANSPFSINKNNKKFQKINFRLINFTPVIPLQINNSDTLYFIVDTGLGTTLITSLFEEDSLKLNYAKKIFLKGLGIGKEIETIQSLNNKVKIGRLSLNNIPINVLVKDIFNLSSIYGTPIHGIIGYSLFQHLVVEINYQNKYIKLYDPAYFKYKNKKRRVQFPINFYNKKPFIHTNIIAKDNAKVRVKLLVDSGASLAFWLSPNSSNEINIPDKSFTSLIGQGLNGNIFGDIGRINELHLGKYKLKNIITAFPDSLSIKWMLQNENRNGSIGGEVLYRFNVIIDYPNQKFSLKPNFRFREKFYYNLSGLDIRKPLHKLPIYKVHLVGIESPAMLAGIKKEDIILEINGKLTAQMTLGEISNILNNLKKPYIKMKIQRENLIHEKSFFLKPRI